MESVEIKWSQVKSFETVESEVRCFPLGKPSGKSFPVKSRWIGYLETILVRGNPTTPLNTPWESHFGEIRGYRLPSNHSGVRKTDPGFEFPMSNYPRRASKLSTVSLLAGNVLLTRLQTNAQTNLFNFVRPSFQSRESKNWKIFSKKIFIWCSLLFAFLLKKIRFSTREIFFSHVSWELFVKWVVTYRWSVHLGWG